MNPYLFVAKCHSLNRRLLLPLRCAQRLRCRWNLMSDEGSYCTSRRRPSIKRTASSHAPDQLLVSSEEDQVPFGIAIGVHLRHPLGQRNSSLVGVNHATVDAHVEVVLLLRPAFQGVQYARLVNMPSSA